MAFCREGLHAGAFLRGGQNGGRSLETGLLKAGESVVAGQVLGRELALAVTAGPNTGDGAVGSLTVGPDAQVGVYELLCTGTGGVPAATGTAQAAAGNEGDGSITAEPATGVAAKVGVYRVTCVQPAVDGGTFLVEDPDGVTVGTATVGVECTADGHLTFTIADGTADFAAGDSFTITVAAANSGAFSVTAPNGMPLANATVGEAYSSSHLAFTVDDGATDFAPGDSFQIAVAPGSWVALDFASTAGGQTARGVSYAAVDATLAALPLAVVVRDAAVNGAALTWPESATVAQVAQATLELARGGVVLR